MPYGESAYICRKRFIVKANDFMRSSWLVATAFFAAPQNVQTPEPRAVPMINESHYRLLFENAYVRVVASAS